MNPRQIAEDIVRILVAGIDPLPGTISQMEEARQGGDFPLAVELATRRWSATKKTLAADMVFWWGVWQFYRAALDVFTAPMPRLEQDWAFQREMRNANDIFAASSQAFARAGCKHGCIAASLAQGRINHLISNRVDAQRLYEEGQQLCKDAERRDAHRRAADRYDIYPNLDWRIRGWITQLHEPNLPCLIREIKTGPVAAIYTLGEDTICQPQQIAIDDQRYQLINHQNRHEKSRLPLLPTASYFIVSAPDDSMAAIEPRSTQIDIHRGDRLLAEMICGDHLQANGAALPPENRVGVFQLPNGFTVLRTAKIWDNLILLEPANPRRPTRLASKGAPI